MVLGHIGSPRQHWIELPAPQPLLAFVASVAQAKLSDLPGLSAEMTLKPLLPERRIGGPSGQGCDREGWGSSEPRW